MTFAIHASKIVQKIVTVRISPAVAVDKPACWRIRGGKCASSIHQAISLNPLILIGFYQLPKRQRGLFAPLLSENGFGSFFLRPILYSSSQPSASTETLAKPEVRSRQTRRHGQGLPCWLPMRAMKAKASLRPSNFACW
jgi:hypothetical protein